MPSEALWRGKAETERCAPYRDIVSLENSRGKDKARSDEVTLR
jgi:hypothetical protein